MIRRVLAALCTAALVAGLVLGQLPLAARAAAGLCANPGTRQTGTISGIINTYYPGVGTAAAGATTISVGTSVGATTAIGAQDLLLVIQMQDSTINSSNSSSYGNGSTGTGSLSDQTSGYYEYVVAQGPVSGGTVTIAGTGAGGGLINTYHTAAANASQGQQTFQVIRVPQYSTATINITGTGTGATPWNGATGGVFAVDVQGALTVTALNVDGDGFRGGAVEVLTGNGTTEPAAPQVKNQDFVVSSGAGYHGLKGEGTVGTPYAVYTGSAIVTYSETLPGGSYARGAPGNAGGGGSDEDPSLNDQNTGGGGGAGAGAGGRGGNNWSPSSSGSAADNAGTENASEGIWQTGGLGGTPVTGLGVTRWTLGGGGGAGSNNNGTTAPYGSSGGVGGGVVLIRTGTASGGGTISAGGTTGTAPVNDGGGGGGGGGTIFVTATGNITATAKALGGAGTTANASNGNNNQDHGPGGGGGGGMIVTTQGSLTTNVAGGVNGTTTSNANPYGAVAGSAGKVVQTDTTSIPGADSGAECVNASTTAWTIGPSNYATATGSYDGAVTANNQNDFTAVNVEPKNTATTVTSDGTANAITTQLVASTAPCIAHSLTVTSTQNYELTVTAPYGWQVGIYTNNTCTALFGGSTIGQQTMGTQNNLAAGTYTVYTQYTTASTISIVPLTRYDATLSLYVSGTPGTNNQTHDELYYGFVRVVKSMSVSNTANVNCGSNAACKAGTNAIPGSTITYSLAYANMVVNASSESTLTAPVPYPYASGLAVGDDGTLAGSWATYSNGLTDALTDTTSGTTFTYTKNGTATGTAAGATQFTATVGGAGFLLEPPGITGTGKGNSGTITFSIILK